MTVELPRISAVEAYERFIVRNLFRPWTHDLIGRAQPLEGKRFLDLACGTGIVSRTLFDHLGRPSQPGLVDPGLGDTQLADTRLDDGSFANPGLGNPEPGHTESGEAITLIGLDISPAMLAKAEMLTEDLEADFEWHEGCGTRIPFPDQAFDCVFCQQGLQFFPDPQVGLKEIRRVLVPGGQAIASVWGPLDGNPFYGVINDLVSAHLVEGALALPFALSDPALVLELATAAGLNQVRVEQAELEIHAAEPELFAAMCLRGAAAVLPEFAALPQLNRDEVIERMNPALEDAVRPFQCGDELIFKTTVNVLTAMG